MLAILSPSKTINEDKKAVVCQPTIPQFLDDSEQLIDRLKAYSEGDLAGLMKISPKLAALNAGRYRSFSTPFTKGNAKQAFLSFKGDVYDGLNVDDFSEQDFLFAQDSIRIISGLYGLLRPLDLMQPYRLEMGTKLQNNRGRNLYEFWGDKITEKINEDKGNILINLASKEYFSAINRKKLRARLINVDFKEKKDGKYKIIGLFAKKARGMMARHIVKNRINETEELKSFKDSDYKFNQKLSDNDHWIFTRDTA